MSFPVLFISEFAPSVMTGELFLDGELEPRIACTACGGFEAGTEWVFLKDANEVYSEWLHLRCLMEGDNFQLILGSPTVELDVDHISKHLDRSK